MDNTGIELSILINILFDSLKLSKAIHTLSSNDFYKAAVVKRSNDIPVHSAISRRKTLVYIKLHKTDCLQDI